MSKAKKEQVLSKEQMAEELRRFVNKKGSVAAAAAALSTTSGHISEILSGERTVGDSIANQLGFYKVKQVVKTVIPVYIGEPLR